MNFISIRVSSVSICMNSVSICMGSISIGISSIRRVIILGKTNSIGGWILLAEITVDRFENDMCIRTTIAERVDAPST